MNIPNTAEIVERLRQALQARNFSAFVGLFAPDALFEVPFGLQENQKRLQGIDAIRAHFDIMAQNPATKLRQLHQVNATLHRGNDDDRVIFEFR